jgi:hypothetical protein
VDAAPKNGAKERGVTLFDRTARTHCKKKKRHGMPGMSAHPSWPLTWLYNRAFATLFF